MNSKKHICCIFNYPSHYRFKVYKMMEDELDCDFYFGNIDEGILKKMEYDCFKKEVHNLKTKKIFFNINWISGSVSLILKPYSKYVITGDPYCLSDWAILFAKYLFRKKVYLWTHGWYGDENRVKIILKKIFLGMADGVFLYGNYAYRLMVAQGFSSAKLHVLYNSLDYEAQITIRDSLKKTDIYYRYFGNNYPVVIFTGRLTKIKRLDMLIEAHLLLLEEGRFFNVVLLGDGESRKDMIDQVEALKIRERYWFYGPCYEEEIISELYYNATLCVSPGNVGLTSIHALMYGCPVITHSNFSKQVPEFETIESGVNGDFFVYNDVKSLAQIIEKWLTEHTEKDEMLIRNCFKKIDSQYNPQYQLKILKSVLL